MTPELIAWLTNPLFDANRTVLIEAEHSTGVVYLSTLPYLSESSIAYDALLLEEPVFEESLDAHAGIGDFVVINHSTPEVWQSFSWVGCECRFYFGDVTWPRAAFAPIARTLIEDVRRDGLRFIFDVVDRGALLEKPIAQLDIDVRGEAKEIPLCFGALFNVAPVLIDYAEQVYQAHDGAVLSVQPRDNGIPVDCTTLLAAGKFKLANNPIGFLSCEVQQSDKTLLAVLQQVATRAGFEVVHFGTQSWQRLAVVGLYVTGEPSFASLLDELVASVGCWWRLDALGRIEVISDQAQTLDITITDDDILDLQPAALERPNNKITVNFAPNHVVLDQGTLAGAVEVGVLTQAQATRLTQAHSAVTAPSFASTGAFASSLEQTSVAVEQSVADALLALLTQRKGSAHRRWTGQMRSVAWGLRVGDRVSVDCDDVRGVGLITRMARARSGGLTDVELLI